MPVQPSRSVTEAESKLFARRLGLARWEDLAAYGVTASQAQWAVATGRWQRVVPGLYALPAWPPSELRRLLAACIATKGVASHLSAAWLWGLWPTPPAGPVVSVPHGRNPQRRPAARPNDLIGTLTVHRSRDLGPQATSWYRDVPTTNPLRTLVDMASTSAVDVLDEALDVALASRLVTADGLEAELGRLHRRGRRGPPQLARRLRQRFLAGAPSPSVLESQVLRLLSEHGIPVLAREVVVSDGKFRVDMQVGPRVFVEVDGYAYHWSPEQKRHDDARRDTLRLNGACVLVYDWQSVSRGQRRVVSEVRQAVQEVPTSSPALPTSPGGPGAGRSGSTWPAPSLGG